MAIKTTSAKEINYVVEKKIGVLSTHKNGNKELRLVSWNGRESKYDIRDWETLEDGTEKCGKGITLTGEELLALKDLIIKEEEE